MRSSQRAAFSGAIFTLLCILLAVLGATTHHTWLVVMSAVCWIIATGHTPKAMGGLPLGGALVVGFVLLLVSLLFWIPLSFLAAFSIGILAFVSVLLVSRSN